MPKYSLAEVDFQITRAEKLLVSREFVASANDATCREITNLIDTTKAILKGTTEPTIILDKATRELHIGVNNHRELEDFKWFNDSYEVR